MRAEPGMTDPSAPRPARRLPVLPHVLFFPAAALYAASILPWSVLSMTGVVAGPAALSTGPGHAHEMLLGYALAVVAGYQLPPRPLPRVLLLFGSWVLARAAYLAGPGGLASIFDIVFITALGMHVAPRLFRAAKKLRNRALPGILVALCVVGIAYEAAACLAGTASLPPLMTAVVLLLAALMLFMGGRIIAPAVAGQAHRQGRSLAARVQPRVEGWLIVAMTVAVIAALVPSYERAMRGACAGAAVLALVRLLRWQLWACRGRPDLLCLGAGYGCLALGLAAIAASSAGAERAAALHLVTVGALGTLTFNVMAATLLHKARRDPAAEPLLVWGTVAIGVAAVLRLAASLAPARGVELLVVSSALWTGAFVALCWLIARCLRATGRRRAAEADA